MNLQHSYLDLYNGKRCLHQLITSKAFQYLHMLMQGISTHLQIYVLSTMPINQRSISTVGIKSFFSDITTHMEFSGLGCPKAVDIPCLITQVTELNTIRHDPNHGFAFSTTNRGAYPYDILLPPSDVNQTRFDLPHPRKQ